MNQDSMDEKQFRALIDKYLDGNANEREKRIAEEFMDSFAPKDGEWIQEISGAKYSTRVRILHNIYTKYKERTGAGEEIYDGKARKMGWTGILLRAAAVLLIGMVGYGAYVLQFQDQQDERTAEVSDISPGSNKAVLELSDGTQIELDSTGSAVIPQQGTAQVINESGKLAYLQGEGSAEEILYNTIITPRGGQYQLTLADGSGVWLNAESSLRFPAAFAGKERIVELTGEAYFEIAKNENMPFRVRIPSGTEVEVLGTHFNIMAYEEEPAIKTTLLEGSVKIYSRSGAQVGSVRLKPNQQGQLTSDGNISVIKDYDVTEAVAWKNGMFIFSDTGLETIMRQVSRWYDVEVTYEDDFGTLKFGGVVSRKENASAVLNLLELTEAVDFEIRGREIIVKSVKK